MVSGYTISSTLIGSGAVCAAASFVLWRAQKRRQPADIRTILRTGASGDHVSRPRRDRMAMVPLTASGDSEGPPSDAACALRRAFSTEVQFDAQTQQDPPAPAPVVANLLTAFAGIVIVGPPPGVDEHRSPGGPLHFVLV